MQIRPETPHDLDAIRTINIEAFRDHPVSQQTEHLIVDALRDAGALDISLVAEIDGEVVGHIAFSAAAIGTTGDGWWLLGPVAVLPDRQRCGVGKALINAGLAELSRRAAKGCALVGDPAYYTRFGFRSLPAVNCEGVPDQYVLVLPLAGEEPAGELTHHAAFFVTA